MKNTGTLALAILITAALSASCDKDKTSSTTATTTAPTATPPPASSTTTTPTPTPTATTTAASTAIPKFDPIQLNPFAPIPEAVEKPVLDDATKLGQMLYFDTRLSKGQDVACSSCHDLAKSSGTDGGAKTSTGTKKVAGKRNTPTVINSGGSFAQGWDAKTTQMEEFIVPHLLDPSIAAFENEKKIVDLIESIPGYAAAFKKAFPDAEKVSGETIGRALGTFTKKLFARSRWDKYLAGDKSALTDDELSGLAMFVEAGCITCHQGKYIGATQSQKLGVAKAWPPPTGTELGRFEVTKQEADRGMWKVPSLRNVTKTAPYLHDGSMATLEETTKMMSRHQIGKELSDPQIKAIVAFLGTLSGDPPKELVQKPAALPPSGPKTPKPE
jgi:cytochrome c peroxidase